MDELLTRDEVAKLLKVKPITVYRLTKQGKLPAVKLGGRFVRYQKHDVLSLIDRHTTYRVEEEGGKA
ncbi:helix-turn-helix transcriptional regulator [Chloroflexota bacterium]